MPRREAEATSVSPIGGDAELWVSPTSVRQRIGAWAYDRAAEVERPGAVEVRRALAVAAAVVEAAHAVWRAPDVTPLWEVEVPAVDAELARRAGLAQRDVAGALELLIRVGALTRAGADGDAVRLARDVLEAAPAVARVAWAHVRARLEAVGVALPPALAVLRELARASGPVPETARAPYVRYSVRELEAATQFGRSTVSEALAALERAGLIALDARRGQTMRCALAPAPFGHEGPESSVAPPMMAAEAPVASSAAAASSGAAPPPTVTVAHSGAAPVLVGEFAGTPIFAPPGTPLVVECDAEGRWSCRVGPLLRLGPVSAP